MYTPYISHRRIDNFEALTIRVNLDLTWATVWCELLLIMYSHCVPHTSDSYPGDIEGPPATLTPFNS